MDIRLGQLFPELLNIKNFIDSSEKIDPVMDLVVGELPDYLKALYTLLKLSEESMHGAVIKAREVIYINADIEKHICEACEAGRKYETLKELFKILAKKEFDLRGDKCCSRLGVRQGFLLVKPAGYQSVRNMFLSGSPEEILQKLRELSLKERFCQN